MEVILSKDVNKLGKAGDIVKVKKGYAINFLIPQKMAKICTQSNMNVLKEEQKRLNRRLENEKKKAEQLREKLSNISCTVTVQVGAEDKLFGSVTKSDIQAAYETEGIKIDKKLIELKEPIKALGVYNVSVKLHPEVIAEGKVWVVKE